MLPVDLTSKYIAIAKICVKVQEMKWESVSKFIINLFPACIVPSCIIITFLEQIYSRNYNGIKHTIPHCITRINKEERFSEGSSHGLLFNVHTIVNLHSMMRILTKLLTPWPWFTNFTQFRPAKTGFDNNICWEHVQACSVSISAHIFYYLSFLFHSECF